MRRAAAGLQRNLQFSRDSVVRGCVDGIVVRLRNHADVSHSASLSLPLSLSLSLSLNGLASSVRSRLLRLASSVRSRLLRFGWVGNLKGLVWRGERRRHVGALLLPAHVNPRIHLTSQRRCATWGPPSQHPTLEPGRWSTTGVMTAQMDLITVVATAVMCVANVFGIVHMCICRPHVLLCALATFMV